jgi:RNA ligase
MIMRLQARNCTAIFEWTAPDARIVVHYPEAGLQLLHVRNNITGRYWDSDELHTIADEYGVKMVDEVDEFFWTMGGDGLPETREFDIQKMLKAAETRENIEGWVIQFEDGEMVKLKTKWYMERHRLMTFLRERDIAEAVLNETLDDTKAMLVGEGVNIQEILDIEARVLHEVRQLALAVDLVYNADKHLSRKDFAIKHQGEEFFGLMMSRFIGKEPDFKGYFQKTKLKDMFGLRQLVLMPSIAEGE